MWFIRLLVATYAILVASGHSLGGSPTNAFDSSILFSTQDLNVLVNETRLFSVQVRGNAINSSALLSFEVNYDNYVDVRPHTLEIKPSSGNKDYIVDIKGIRRGRLVVSTTVKPGNQIDASKLFVRIVVAYSHSYVHLSWIVGWAYTILWMICDWPQMYKNFQRKSVVGLNFDYVLFNSFGHMMYFMYNAGAYFSSYIEEEYFRRHPKGQNPVKFNDIIFSGHAICTSFVIIAQCSMYERAQQTVSKTARIILFIFASILIISGGLASFDVIHWLNFLLICSYIKLCASIKTLPQVYMHYKKKSTEGWSIVMVMMDFAGGIFSMLQMLIDAYNYDDFGSILGDPTKFLLGLYCSTIDMIFMIQHFILYRPA